MSNFFSHFLSLVDSTIAMGSHDYKFLERILEENVSSLDTIWYNPNFPGDCSNLMIHLVRRRCLPLVKKMVELGSQTIDVGVGFYPPPLHIAVEGNDLSMTRYVLSVCPTSRMTQDKMGNYAIFAGVINDNRATVLELLKFPEQITLLDRYGRTCLHIAVLWQQYVSSAMIEFLLSQGVETSIVDSFGHTAKEYAEIYNNLPALGLLN